ncbi:tetratricopeptide repeat protein [Pukyongiella litopenaei]|uniref:Tetratricopeptide repeat protein n=1 Tax=Pukyongiella litopenaei TaxID=2605946 RepID=A0A2S0MLN2_9RHOB|nr:tetratricopeptide repeat protein [Pukyongiella litopenaei]AVO36782.1 tetratricopeptide repeat protein [Pukyongiella litopenaei]
MTGLDRRAGARRTWLGFGILALAAALAGCAPRVADGPHAPGVDPRGTAVDGEIVGGRLLEAGEYALATDAFTRAALNRGMTPEILTGLGTAALGQGRLGQAETILRRAVAADPSYPAAWNNLGVVLMERGMYPEAEQVFRRAFAADAGRDGAIRENLIHATAKVENPAETGQDQAKYTLVRQGGGSWRLQDTGG